MARKCKLRISSAVKLTLANFGKVPIADDGFLELPARYPTLDVTFDVLGTMDQLTP
jgi:hypothetical protein